MSANLQNLWKSGDLVRNGLDRYGIVVEVEQLLPEFTSTEAFIIEPDGTWTRTYPYEVMNQWIRLRATGIQYAFTTYEQVKQDYLSGLFTPFFA